MNEPLKKDFERLVSPKKEESIRNKFKMTLSWCCLYKIGQTRTFDRHFRFFFFLCHNKEFSGIPAVPYFLTLPNWIVSSPLNVFIKILKNPESFLIASPMFLLFIFQCLIRFIKPSYTLQPSTCLPLDIWLVCDHQSNSFQNCSKNTHWFWMIDHPWLKMYLELGCLKTGYCNIAIACLTSYLCDNRNIFKKQTENTAQKSLEVCIK